MNRKINLGVVLLVLVALRSISVAQMPEHSSLGMKETQEEQTMMDETLGISPQLGAISYIGKNGETDGRQLLGLGLNLNFASLFKNNVRDYYFGISTGSFYSHLGSTSSGFFGSNDDQGSGGANLIVIPADVKIGYNFTDSFRASLHGGGNLIYRSIANSASLGDGSLGDNSLWKMYPNLGADFEFQLGKMVSLIARPDLTIAPDQNLFIGTLGATIMMGL